MKLHPEPWSFDVEQEYHKRFSATIERWLDAGHGACLLRRQDCAAVVDETLQHFDGDRVGLISSVVMPNHAHALFVLNSEWQLDRVVGSWKSFTKSINKLLGRSGTFWQRDYFDRIVRDEQHFANCIRYIRRNPEKAQLTKGEFLLYESALANDTE